MAKDKPARLPIDPPLVPLADLADIDEIDAILLGAIDGTRKEVHEAISRVLDDWLGRTRYEVHKRFCWLKRRELRKRNANRPRQRAYWDEEQIEMLLNFYAQGLAGARQAGKVMPALYPDLTPREIQRKAAELGLTNPCGPRRPWTTDDDRTLRWLAGEKGLSFLSEKFKRSTAAIQQHMSRRGLSARVRMPNYFNLHQVSIMLGVSDSGVRVWFEKGIFEPYGKVKLHGNGRSKVLIHENTLVAFCVAHPEKVNAKRCHPDVRRWLGEQGKRAGQWNGSRQHLTQQKECPRCGREIIGNAYFRHVMNCGAPVVPPATGGNSTGRRDQMSSGSNV
jgi:hypothetical protein